MCKLYKWAPFILTLCFLLLCSIFLYMPMHSSHKQQQFLSLNNWLPALPNKPMVLQLSASWCRDCKENAMLLMQYNIKPYALCYEQECDDMSGYMQISYANSTQDILDLAATGVPEIWVLDHQRKVLWYHQGLLSLSDVKEIKNILRDLLIK